MKRLIPFVLFGLVLVLTGCANIEERRQLPALPDDAPPQPYIELVLRARDHATRANEAFYINNWALVEASARSLEQVARFLVGSTEMPPKIRDRIKELAADLRESAVKLRESAVSRNEDDTTKAMAEVHRKVRALRPGE